MKSEGGDLEARAKKRNASRDVNGMSSTSRRTGPPDSGSPSGKGGHYFALSPGTKLLEYEIEDLLGHGGFGITYRALDTVLRQSVAIKEYLPNDIAVRVSDATVKPKSDGDEDDFQSGLRSFLEEARVITRFRHSNIVRVRRFFELHGTGYIALDYEQGQTLSRRLSSGSVPEAELLHILHGIIDGLENIHEEAVLHRDLKPSNIILRDDGTPVLIDFGAARDFRDRHSRSITAIAAPGYSPPEQYGVGGQQGPWTDIYALGAIAYKCVTGNAPPDSLRRLRSDPLVSAVKAANGKYDRELLRTIDWMLSIEESKRPSSVQVVRNHLPPKPGSANARRFQSARRRRPMVAVAASVAVLLTVGAVTATNYDRIRAMLSSSVGMQPPARGPRSAKPAAKSDAPANESKTGAPAGSPPTASQAASTAPAAVPAAAATPAAAAASAATVDPAAMVPLAAIAAPKPTGPDELAWDFLKDGNDPEQLRLFLQQFPASSHREAAVAKLAALGQAPHAAPPKATPTAPAAAQTVLIPSNPPPAAPTAIGSAPSPAGPGALPGPATSASLPAAAKSSAPATPATAPLAPGATPSQAAEAGPGGPKPDEIAWDFLKDSGDPVLLRQFINRYPASEHHGEAVTRLASLEQKKTASAPAVLASTAPTTPASASPQIGNPFNDSTPVTDPVLIGEIRTRLYELNFDPGHSGQPEQLGQAVRDYEKTSKLAAVGQLTRGLLSRLRQAPPLQPWGSIIYSHARETWGMSWDEPTRSAAVASARKKCGENCPTEISFFGTDCAAFAHSEESWAIISRPNLELARGAALQECRRNGTGCTLIAAVCADGSGQAKK
jgi:serine/threonine protein kinase